MIRLWKGREVGVHEGGFISLGEEEFAGLAEAGFGGAGFVDAFCDQVVCNLEGLLTKTDGLMLINCGVVSIVPHILLLFMAPYKNLVPG